MSKALIKYYEGKYVTNAIENYKLCNPKVRKHGIMLYVMHNFNNINKYNFVNCHLFMKNKKKQKGN